MQRTGKAADAEFKFSTAAAYQSQYDEAIATDGTRLFQQNGFDEEIRVRDRFCTDWVRWAVLRPGLSVVLEDFTPQMFALIRQIWDAPFHPPMQQMYLESRILELLVLQLNQWIRAEQRIYIVQNLKPVEIDKIYQARDLLIQKQSEPPSPLDLARWVNLSDRKLQRGFREVFGTTVFGYLHDYRMEQAQMLLSDRKASIATIANTVGYSHLGYFAAAFKKKFGISPKAWQQGNKLLS
ncbi:MAG: AraC family transcriptional regulator [Aphanocapsa sp. GSE-SYN-MK-11-07L]|jgi:AraC-like DNA-binding protein|nr:AraC family transcriptional regulator [Aphanocapsa sp. GSE-SYN-MK-11-07L]